jgi:hypothetical protein
MADFGSQFPGNWLIRCNAHSKATLALIMRRTLTRNQHKPRRETLATLGQYRTIRT